MIFTDECMPMHTQSHNEIMNFTGVQRTNTENACFCLTMQMFIWQNKKQQGGKYQMTDIWRRLTPLQREALQCLLSIKYLARHNEKILQITKNRQYKMSLNKFLLLICTNKPRE